MIFIKFMIKDLIMLTKLRNGFLKVFGDIKLYKWPFFLLYHPEGYRVKGEDVREVIEQIQPGDIVIRGFKDYLDGYFIPGDFTHAGIYLGELTEDDVQYTADECRDGCFKTGKQMVAHAMAEGVFLEDIINFCRCDYMVILRFPKALTKKFDISAMLYSKEHYHKDELTYNERLGQGETLLFGEIFDRIRKNALSQVGIPYDYDFDFTTAREFTCTEYVYYTIKAFERFHGVRPKTKRVLGIFSKKILAPDDYIASPLELVWHSASVDMTKIEKLRR